jgi:TonB-linked SusC/RagA family outer membrane protein
MTPGSSISRIRSHRSIDKTITLAMKLTTLILFVLCLSSAATGFSQISLSEKNVPLAKVLKKIEQQSGYEFLYPADVVEKAGKVTVQVQNATVEQAVSAALKGTALTFVIKEKTVIIREKLNPNIEIQDAIQLPPPIDVKGRVIDEKGSPVIASVQVKGTNKGTTTNDNGEFELKGVDDNATLVISGVSIETFEVKVNGRTDLALVNARTKTIMGEEVKIEAVNTGYQRISKERFVGSFSQLDSNDYRMRAGQPVISRLDGTLPGILFDKKTGSSSLELIQIRGLSTINSSKAPLIIVDNFPFRQDINLINPNDVESIVVLKDAAATSIWGALAGNGVIVITTKKGKFNKPLSLRISSNVTITEKPDQYYYPQMGIPDFIDAEIFLFNIGYYDARLSQGAGSPVVSPVVQLLADRKAGKISAADSAQKINGLKSQDLRRDLDEYVYRPALLQQYYAQLSAGSNIVNYSLSAGYNRQLNNVRNSKPDDNFSINSTVGIKLIKKLNINTGILFTQGNSRSTFFTIADKIYPYAQLADEEGNALAVPNGQTITYRDTAGSGQLLDWKYRPLDEVRLTDRKDLTRFLQLNTNITYRITSWLNAIASYQYSTQTVSGKNFQSIESYATRDLINSFTNLSQSIPAFRNPVPVGGIMNESSAEIKSQNARMQLDFTKRFSIRHQLNAFVAGEIGEVIDSRNSLRFYGYSKENGTFQSSVDYLTRYPQYSVPGINLQVPNETFHSPTLSRRSVSLVGNISYSYQGRYLLYISARKDGSNIFGVDANRKWKPLWSAGTSWEISKESFYSIKWMPVLRLSLTYGYSGNPGYASAVPTIGYLADPTPLTNQVSATSLNAANPGLHWEKVNTMNEAVEFSLFENRLSGRADIYQKTSTDLIAINSLAPSFGLTVVNQNVADLKAKGFEISLASHNLRGAFAWDSRITLSHAKTTVTKLQEKKYQVAELGGYYINASEGMMVYGIASYKWGGLDAAGNPQGYLNKTLSTNYTSLLTDSISSQVFNGSAIPLYFGNLSNAFRWKNFTLTANITYRFDFYFRKPTINYHDLAERWVGNADYSLRWQKTGDEKFTNVPSFIYPIDVNRMNFYKYAEINVLRGDNIRLSDLQLEYHLKKMTTIFLNVNDLNLVLWRKDKTVLDPDYTGGNSFVAPPSRSWTLGCSISL